MAKRIFAKVKTKIPNAGYAPILEALRKYEARSMHGQLPVVWDKAEDFLVSDKYGNRWIDFTSTIFVTNTGHSNPAVIKALQDQLKNKLLHTYTFIHKTRALFLKKLIQSTPAYLQKAFLLSAGTEATECAVKLMRMYGVRKNASKTGIISFTGCMHGRTMLAEMLKGDPKSSKWLGYKDPNIYHLPFPYPWSVKGSCDWAKRFRQDIANLKKSGVNFKKVCGFIIESYQGWAGVLYPKAYVKALMEFAKKYDILVTFDEIQGGFGRTGKLFVFQHYGVKPDLVCIGKGMSAGLPLSAVIGRKKIMDLPKVGSMSSTHSANPICCAAGLANLKEITSRKLITESARKGKILHYHLNKLKDEHPNRISYICGKGLLAGILIVNPKTGKPDGAFATKVVYKAMRNGLLLVHTGRESIKIGPPLTISDKALLEGITILKESFK